MMARKSLSAFAIGITPFMLVKVLAAGFYAKQDMRTPVRIGVIAMVANTVLNVILIWPLAHAGIALSTSLAALINTGFLFYFLRKRGFYQPREGWKLFATRLSISNLVLAVWLWMGAGDLHFWITQHATWRYSHLAFLLITGHSDLFCRLVDNRHQAAAFVNATATIGFILLILGVGGICFSNLFRDDHLGSFFLRNRFIRTRKQIMLRFFKIDLLFRELRDRFDKAI